MVYITTVTLNHQSTSTTYVVYRRRYITATILDLRFAFQVGEYTLLNRNGGVFDPTHYGKETIDEQDLERSILSWCSRPHT
jgi:hypothetical protein